MNKATINNVMNLNYPDGFKEMGNEDLAKHFSSPDNRWGVYNESEHVILSVNWVKAGLFADAEMKMIDLEARLKRGLINYQRVSSYKMEIAKQKAEGIRFEYRVNDTARVHVADLIVFKHKKLFYMIHIITRKSNAGTARRDFEEVLKSITIN